MGKVNSIIMQLFPGFNGGESSGGRGFVATDRLPRLVGGYKTAKPRMLASHFLSNKIYDHDLETLRKRYFYQKFRQWPDAECGDNLWGQ